MIDWDSLQITVLDEDRGVLTETERIYSMQAEQVMVIMSGAAGPAGPRGPKGDKGDAGEAVWGAITGTLSNQTDIQSALDGKPSDAPADDRLYGRQNGVWTPISSAGVVEWGDISGTLSDQTDLQTAINAKLGDAPSDGSEYVRKNGAWAVSGGAGVWGSITGTLSDQTDLQDALDARLRAESVAEEFDPTKSYPAGWNYVTYKGILYRFYGPYHDEWGHMTNYEPVEVKTLIDAKANTADLGAMASVADAPSDGSEYVRKNGAWAVSSGGGGGAPVWGGITGTLADQTDLNTALSGKAEASAVYTKSEMDTALGAKADTTSVYTKTEANALLADKADSADLAGKADASAVYTKTQVDTALSGKADSSAVYSKTEVDTALGAKANSADVTTSLATKADATSVYTKSEVDTALGAKASTADLGALATKDTVDYLTEIDNVPTAFPPSAHTHDDRYYTESEVDTLLGGKQSTLTFDTTPTASSTNPVTSGGIKTALDAKQNTLTFDSTPTASSANPVKSSGIKTALDGKANSSHTHGNISNVGAITTTTALASGDRIVITDSSDSSKVKGTTITFDGSTTTQALSRKGTWESFATSSHTHDDRYYTESEVNTLLGGKQDKLEDSGWVSVTTTNCSAGSIHYRKIGSVVQVVGTGIKLSSALGSGENVTVGTLPSTVRPQTYNAFSFGCAGTANPMFVNLQTDGAIRFYTPSYLTSIGTGLVCYFNATFLVA